MAKRKSIVLRRRKSRRQNCFAFYIGKDGKPACHALNDIYCFKDPGVPCPFRKTPAAAARARQSAALRLANLER